MLLLARGSTAGPTLAFLPFYRLVDEIGHDLKYDLSYAPMAITLLENAMEDHLIGVLKDARVFAKHARRVAVNNVDLDLARRCAAATKHLVPDI